MPILPPDPSGIRLARDATLEESELSVTEKRDAGLLLLSDTAQSFAASGTYLLGYVAEVYLKCAYFRFKEGPAIQAGYYEIDRAKLGAANLEARRLAVSLNVCRTTKATIGHAKVRRITITTYRGMADPENRKHGANSH